MYFEASGLEPGTVAVMTSPEINTISDGTEYCLTFWYHMLGEDLGHLNISLIEGSGEPQEVWSQHYSHERES